MLLFWTTSCHLVTGSTRRGEGSPFSAYQLSIWKVLCTHTSLKTVKTTHNYILNVPKVPVFNDTLNAFCYTTYLKYYENWQSCPILNIQYFIQAIYILNIHAINFKQIYCKYIENLYFFHMWRNDPCYSHFIVHCRQLCEADCIHFIFLLQIWKIFAEPSHRVSTITEPYYRHRVTTM